MNRYAAIDVGTNSVLLLVAERRTDGKWIPVSERSDITRLGQGVDRTKTLAPEALETTLKTLERFAHEARELGAARIVATATSAARDASNGRDLLQGAKARAGIDIEVISGEEEARLSFASAHSDFGGKQPLVVLDIGGGSTELIYGTTMGNITFRRSFDVGSVRLTERHVRTDPPSAQELETIDRMLAEELAVLPAVPANATLVGVAGTATTLAAVAHHVAPYDPTLIHGATLTLEEVNAAVQRLASLPTHLRKTIPGLQPKRADVIVAGALIFRAVLNTLKLSTSTISDRGLRWGLLADRFASAA